MSNLYIYFNSEWATNAAENLADEFQNQKETEAPRSPSFAGVLKQPGMSKAGLSVSGASSIKLLEGSLLPFPTVRLPRGRERPPAHLLRAKAPRPRPLAGPPPSPEIVHSAGPGTAGCTGGGEGLASSLPGVPRLSWRGPWGWAPGLPRGPGTVPPGRPRDPAHAASTSQARARVPSTLCILGPDARLRPRPGPVTLNPSDPQPGARPWPGRSGVAHARRCSLAAPSLTARVPRRLRRRHRLLCLLLTTRPGAHS